MDRRTTVGLRVDGKAALHEFHFRSRAKNVLDIPSYRSGVAAAEVVLRT
jgi:hypothetical protein